MSLFSFQTLHMVNTSWCTIFSPRKGSFIHLLITPNWIANIESKCSLCVSNNLCLGLVLVSLTMYSWALVQNVLPEHHDWFGFIADTHKILISLDIPLSKLGKECNSNSVRALFSQEPKVLSCCLFVSLNSLPMKLASGHYF
jgi:hypothetical protein